MHDCRYSKSVRPFLTKEKTDMQLYFILWRVIRTFLKMATTYHYSRMHTDALEGLLSLNTTRRAPSPNIADYIEVEEDVFMGTEPFDHLDSEPDPFEDIADFIATPLPITYSSDEFDTSDEGKGSGRFNVSENRTGNIPAFDKIESTSVASEEAQQNVASVQSPLCKRDPTPRLYQRSFSLPESTVLSDQVRLEEGYAGTGDNFRLKCNDKNSETLQSSVQVRDTYCTTNVQVALQMKVSCSKDVTRAEDVIEDLPDESECLSLPERNNKNERQTVEERSKKQDVQADVQKTQVKSKGELDADVFEAMQTSLNEHSVTPILKKELQCKIRLRRLSEGKPDIVLDETSERKSYKVCQCTSKTVERSMTSSFSLFEIIMVDVYYFYAPRVE